MQEWQVDAATNAMRECGAVADVASPAVESAASAAEPSLSVQEVDDFFHVDDACALLGRVRERVATSCATAI